VSKERARRRAEREAAAQLEAARAARRARWNVLTRLGRIRRSSAPARPARASTALGRHRARQNAVLLAALVAGNAVYWLLQPAWSWRLGALVASALAWPLLVVVLFDRRSSH
jgi:Flp pilus assembly protein TadB